MAISVANAKKLQWLWKDENKITWIETFIKIANKNGDIVPFILTPEQKMFVNGLERENIVEKSRQLGLSVVTVALAIRECVTKDNATCVLVSHNQPSTNAIFEKLKQQFFSLPSWLQPELLTNNRQALTFANGSSIVCVTAGNKDVGRGSTFTGIIHLSEFAFWKNPERQLKSIMQAMGGENAKLIIESTANGFNKFSELYFQAKNGENNFKPFFFNWINGATLFKEHYKIAVNKYKAMHDGKLLTYEEFDDVEKDLFDNHGMTLEQAIWRRGKIATEGEDTFHVEFPSTDEEAFLVTGSSVFDTKRITSYLHTIATKNITHIPKEHIIGLPAMLQNCYGTAFKIWEMPKRKEKYYIGVDVAEGLGGLRDSSTMFVMSQSGKQVAQYKSNKIKPYEFADLVDMVGRYYNKALLTVEKASGGHSVIERLRYDKHYMNMTKYKSYDEFKRTIWNVGFDTNAKTKSIAVNDAREWFDKGMVDINSKELLEEMKVFVAEDNGSMNAVSGSHDDLISAFWLCIAGIKSNIWYPF